MRPMTSIRPKDKPTPSPIAKASDFFGADVGVEIEVGVDEALRFSADTPAWLISKTLVADPPRVPMEIWLF